MASRRSSTAAGLRGRLLIATLVSAVTIPAAAQTTWHVDDDACPGPGSGAPGDPFCSIQQGIAAAAPGDTVLVMPGTYAESLDFLGKAVTVTSAEGAASTIIVGDDDAPTVRFHGREQPDSVIDGFTITHEATSSGKGISILGSSATVTNSVITGNSLVGPGLNEGAGLSVSGSHGGTLISQTRIIGNTITGIHGGNYAARGGGVAIGSSSDLTILSCVVSGNSIFDFNNPYGGGLAIRESEDILIEDCVISDNYVGLIWELAGGGLHAMDSSIDLVNCSIVNNYLETDSAGTYGAQICAGNGMLRIRNSVVCEGTNPWPWVPLWGVDDMDFAWSLTDPGWLMPGPGNITGDPLFVDVVAGDFRLTAASPCLDAGAPGDLACGADVLGNPRRLDGDLDGSAIVDMGACEFGNVRLDVSGTPTPGGTVVLDLTGTSGLPALLLAGLAPGEACASHYGTLFFDLGAPWWLWSLGTLPVSLPVTIGPNVPAPIDVVLQGVALAPAGPAGNTSNAVTLTIE